MKARALSDAPDELDAEARARIQAWSQARWPFLKAAKLREHWEHCRDWHLSRGVLRANWEATFRNWLRKEAEISGRGRGETELPARVLSIFRG